MKFLFVTFLITVSMTVIVSCSKQEAPSVKSDRERTAEELLRSKACEKVNFVKNFLDRDNILALFQCTAWSKQFPHMYSSLIEIENKHWNHIFSPIGKEFFDNHIRRDRIFKKIQNLDSQDGLDDLAKVINSLSDTNFYDAINYYFTCAEDPNDPVCKERIGRTVSKKEILDLIGLVSIEPNLYGYMSRAIKHLMGAIEGDAEHFRTEILKFYHHRSFDKLRIRLADYFSERIIEGITEQDRLFVAKLLFTKVKNSNQYVLEQWLNSDTLDASKFQKMIAYSAIEKKDLIKDIMVIHNGFEEGLKCEYQTGEGQVVVDERHHVGQFLDNLLHLGHLDFNKKILRQSSLILSAEPFCDSLNHYASNITFIDGTKIVSQKHELSFKKVLADFGEFMSDKDHFKLAQIMANSSVSSKAPQPFYLMEMLKGVIYQSLNELNKVILKNSDSYYKLLLNVMKRVDPELYSASGAIAMITMSEDHTKSFQGVAKFWKFLNTEEKNFLFYFIDRHLDEDTNYVLLFDFYSQMLEELPEVVTTISETLAKDITSKEKTYYALKNIVKNLSGKETLSDFKRFFSRDHIVKTIKVLTRGVVLGNSTLGSFDEQYIDDYVLRIRKNPFEFIFSNSNVSLHHIVNCAKAISSDKNNFYVLMRSLPASCKAAEKAEIAIQVFSWINYIANGYDRDYVGLSSGPTTSFVDDKGLFAPATIRSSIVLLTRIDQNFAPSGEKHGGLDYFFDSFFQTMYKMENPRTDDLGYYFQLEKMAKVINDFNKVDGSTPYYRQSMIRKITKEENFSEIHRYLKMSGEVFADYGHWYNKYGEIGSTYDKNEKQPEKYHCKNFHNLNIGGSPCPSNQLIKSEINTLLDFLRIRNDKDTPTAIDLLLKSAIAGEGLYIPYENDTQKVKRLSLRESFKMMYELTDRKDKTNRKRVQYLPKGVKPSKVESTEYLQEMTTLERVEVTIREINFDGSYLAAIYHNAVARAEDYNEAVSGTVKLFKTCHKLRFCGKTFKKDEYRAAHNGIESYNGLLDSNTVYGYGDYMQSLLQILVGSSSKKSRKENMLGNLPKIPTKKQMKKHNGKIVYEVSAISGFSNAGRIIHDRVGRTAKEFTEFLDSKEFRLFSSELLRGYDSENIEEQGISLINNLLAVKNEKGELIHEKVVDYLSALSYPDLRFLERTVSKILVALSYIGSPDLLYNEKEMSETDLYYKRRYSKNNFYGFFKAMNKMLKVWPVFEKALPTRFNGNAFNLIEFLKPIGNVLTFFNSKLASVNKPSQNMYYQFLNESFLFLNEMFFYQGEDHKTGMDYSVALATKFEKNKNIQETLRTIYAYFYQLHQNRSGNSFIEFGENIKTLVSDQLLNMNSLRDYFYHTTREESCYKNTKNCETNSHFDEPARLLNFSLKKHKEKAETNLSVGFKNILIEDRSALTEMINDVMPYIDVVPTTKNLQ